MIGQKSIRRPDSSDNRAVSDVLAFILVFSVIITSAGLVYTFGMGALDDAQVSEQNRNAERAFETLTVSFNDLQDGSAQERVSQINPRGGQISVDDSPTVTVNDSNGDITSDRGAGSLNYAHEGTTVSYELGAAFRSDDGHSVMVRPPEFVCTTTASGTNLTILSYSNLNSTQSSSISTSSALRVQGSKNGTDVNRSEAGDTTIEIKDSMHADAWERYFEESGWRLDSRPSDNTGDVTATCETEGSSATAFVRETELEIELLS